MSHGVTALREIYDQRLFGTIDRYGSTTAIIDEHGQAVSYAALAQLADELVGPIGPKRSLVAIEAANELLPLAAYVGAMRAGHVAILLKEGDVLRDDRIIRRFPPRYVFRRDPDGWGFAPTPDVADVALHEDLALLLSSSGSTGDPKLIRLSHANLTSNGRAIAEYLEIEPDERAISTLPFHYSYGLSVINSHLLGGASVILNDLSVSDAQFWERFASLGATSFAGVPHSFDLLAITDHLSPPPPTLRYFTVAGGRLAPKKISHFAELARDSGRRFYVMYGQTEAAPRMAYMPPELLIDHPHAIGFAIPGGSLTLLDTDGREIQAPGIVGELVYHGPNVMMGYATDVADLARGPMVSSLRTGDLASRDANGLFTIEGRKSRFVKLFGLRINLDDIERWLSADGRQVAVAGDDFGLVVAAAAAGEGETLTKAIVDRYGLTRAVVQVREYDALPRLPSGKVDYAAVLRSRPPERPKDAAASDPSSLSADLAELLGLPDLSPDQSFASAGGDSLNFITASMIIEDRLGYCPNGWEGMGIAELEALIPQKTEKRPGVASDVLIRCVSILLVVLHHGSAVPIDGAAAALLLVAGFNFGRFQSARVAQQGALRAIAGSLVKLVPLYYAVMLLYFGIKRDIFWPNLLLYANFTKGYDDGNTVIGLYWFIEAYIYLIAVCSLIVAIPVIRRLEKRHGFAFALVLIGASVAMHAASMPTAPVRFAQQHPPFLIFYIFALGWALTFAVSTVQKTILSLIGLVVLTFFRAHNTIEGYYVLIPAMLLLLWCARIELQSAGAARLINHVARSSLYIYLVHPLIFMPLIHVFGNGHLLWVKTKLLGAIFITIPLAVAAGIFVHYVVDLATLAIRRRLGSGRTGAAAVSAEG